MSQQSMTKEQLNDAQMDKALAKLNQEWPYENPWGDKDRLVEQIADEFNVPWDELYLLFNEGFAERVYDDICARMERRTSEQRAALDAKLAPALKELLDLWGPEDPMANYHFGTLQEVASRRGVDQWQLHGGFVRGQQAPVEREQ